MPQYAAFFVAVREGFEPSVQFPVRQFSKLILSASQAPHLLEIRNPFFKGTANIAIQKSRQNFFVNSKYRLIIYPHMINTHQHALEYLFDGFDIFQRNIAVFQLILVQFVFYDTVNQVADGFLIGFA